MSKPMMVNDNGVIRPITPEETAELERLAEQMPKPELTPEERIAKLEAENAYLIEALELILSGATEVSING